MGDYWRDHREYQREQRRQMVDCAGCQRRVFPGEVCMMCQTITCRDGSAAGDGLDDLLAEQEE